MQFSLTSTLPALLTAIGVAYYMRELPILMRSTRSPVTKSGYQAYYHYDSNDCSGSASWASVEIDTACTERDSCYNGGISKCQSTLSSSMLSDQAYIVMETYNGQTCTGTPASRVWVLADGICHGFYAANQTMITSPCAIINPDYNPVPTTCEVGRFTSVKTYSIPAGNQASGSLTGSTTVTGSGTAAGGTGGAAVGGATSTGSGSATGGNTATGVATGGNAGGTTGSTNGGTIGNTAGTPISTTTGNTNGGTSPISITPVMILVVAAVLAVAEM